MSAIKLDNYKTQAMMNVQIGEPKYFDEPLGDERHFFNCDVHGKVMANHVPKYERFMDGVRGLPPVGYSVYQRCDKCANIEAERLRGHDEKSSLEAKEKKEIYSMHFSLS